VILDVRKRIREAVAARPWESLRDAVVLTGIMLFAVLMAQHFDIFAFAQSFASPRREISPAETVLLCMIGAACIGYFVSRRLREVREDDRRARDAGALASEVQVLRELALRDPLTGLPNRRVLLDALDLAAEAPDQNRVHAVFLLDLNGFKGINDRYGHAVGDGVLRAVVERFKNATRADDVFARLGGDEFAALSRNVSEKEARAIGNRFVGALDDSVQVAGVQHAIGVSVGVALFPADGDTVEKILRHADVAMYCAKSQGQSKLVFFSEAAADKQPAHTLMA